MKAEYDCMNHFMVLFKTKNTGKTDQNYDLVYNDSCKKWVILNYTATITVCIHVNLCKSKYVSQDSSST